MRRILAMAYLAILQVVRDRGQLITMLALPIVLTWVFGAAFGSMGADRPLLVMWEKGEMGRYSRQIHDLVDAEESIEVETATYAVAKKRLSDGATSLIVRVPEGFDERIEAGEPVSLEIAQAPGAAAGNAALEVVSGAVARVSANAQAASVVASLLAGSAAQGVPGAAQPASAPSFGRLYDTAESYWEPKAPISVSGVKVRESDVRGDTVLPTGNVHYSVGFTLMFVLMMSFGAAGGILEEREQGTLRRLLATPSTRRVIVAGKAMSVIGTGALEAAILVGLGALAFGVEWGRDPLALVLILGSYILASAGLAVFVTSMVRTRGQLSAIAPIIPTGLAMLGGCYWPIEITPEFMQDIAKFTPTGWGMSGLLDVIARGQGLEAAWLPAAILLGIAAVTFGLGLAFLRLE